MKTTKEQIIKASISFFAKNGYEATLVKDIAASLNITKAAIYKHFDSKEVLYNAMITYIENYYGKMINDMMLIPDIDSFEKFKALSLKQIAFTMHDELIKNVRRLLVLEQYRDSRMANLASKHFTFDLTKRFKKIFDNMIDNGLFACDDVELLAFCYTSPITILIGLYDRDNTCETYVISQIERYIDAFIKELKVSHEIVK